MTPMLKKGAKEYITNKDLPSLLKQDQAAELGQRLTAALAKRWSCLPRRCLVSSFVDPPSQEIPILGTCHRLRAAFRFRSVSQARARLPVVFAATALEAIIVVHHRIPRSS
jgi:hypothetical protein